MTTTRTPAPTACRYCGPLKTWRECTEMYRNNHWTPPVPTSSRNQSAPVARRLVPTGSHPPLRGVGRDPVEQPAEHQSEAADGAPSREPVRPAPRRSTPEAIRAQTPQHHPTIHARSQWNPHLLGPTTRPLVTTILHHPTTHRPTPRTTINALTPTTHPKTIETTLDGLRRYGAITGRRHIRLTTLGAPWADTWLTSHPSTAHPPRMTPPRRPNT